MPPPPPRGAPPAPKGGPMINASALAAIKAKAARIPRSQVAEADESFAQDDTEYSASNRDDRDNYRSSNTRSTYDDDRDDDYKYSSSSRTSARDYDRDDMNDMRDGDGYGDGYGSHSNEYDDYGRDDERVYSERDALSHSASNGDDYLNAVHEDEDTRRDDDYGSGSIKGAHTASNNAQPKKMSSYGKSTDPAHFESPYDYEPPSRLPTAPETLEIFNFRPILKATYRELRNFVLSPVPPGSVVRCYIERNKSGSNMMAPFYSFCADLEDGTGRELMVCKKVFYSMQSHHIFSLKGDDLYRKREQRSRLYLGKLRGNSDKTNFVLYDNGNIAVEAKDSKYTPGSGEDPDYHPMTYMPDAFDVAEAKETGAGIFGGSGAKDAKGTNRDDPTSLYRKELAVINYNTPKRPAPKGIRGTEVAIPATFLNANTQAYWAEHEDFMRMNESKVPNGKTTSLPVNTVPSSYSDGIVEPFSRARAAGMQNVKQTKHCFIIHERTSKYDPLSACLIDFKARANVASTKNCQFIESSPQESCESQDEEYAKPFIFQMGKTTEDCFNVDVKYPFSLLQAFAVCVSRFDAKLNW